MIINGVNLPNIGLIRAKLHRDGRYTLVIFPPGPGPLAGAEPATMIELTVERETVERIARFAPHLLSARAPYRVAELLRPA